jgi:hypothetical protein
LKPFNKLVGRVLLGLKPLPLRARDFKPNKTLLLVYTLALRSVFTCNCCRDFMCGFLLLTDVNECMSYECSDKGTHTQNMLTQILIHIHQKTKIVLEVSAKIASVNGSLACRRVQSSNTQNNRGSGCPGARSPRVKVPQGLTG